MLHLTGSPTSAFFAELSRVYAADCLEAAADPAREDVIVHVDPGGGWRFPAALRPDALAAAPPLPVAEAIAHVVALGVDVAVPQMFCPAGMTHHRALLDVLGIPYVGNTPEAMALSLHKQRARAVVAAAGVAVPEGELLVPGRAPTLEPPVVVKPVDVDNSLGVGLVLAPDGYSGALADAFAHAREVLVERYVPPGREVRCGVVARGGELHALPLEEYDVDADAKPIRDAADKLARGDDDALRLVAKDDRSWIVDRDDPVCEAVWTAARRAYVALGCRHYGLFDFRVDADGRPWFLEAGLYCSYARQSVICTMAAAEGVTPAALLREGVAHVLEHRRASAAAAGPAT